MSEKLHWAAISNLIQIKVSPTSTVSQQSTTTLSKQLFLEVRDPAGSHGSEHCGMRTQFATPCDTVPGGVTPEVTSAPPPRYRARHPQPGGAGRSARHGTRGAGSFPGTSCHPRERRFPGQRGEARAQGERRDGSSPVLTAHGGAGRAAASGGRGGRDTSGSERGRPFPLPATRRVRRRRRTCAGPSPHGPPPTTPIVLCGQRENDGADAAHSGARLAGSCSPAPPAILMGDRVAPVS